jgi:hypothetical protein
MERLLARRGGGPISQADVIPYDVAHLRNHPRNTMPVILPKEIETFREAGQYR